MVFRTYILVLLLLMGVFTQAKAVDTRLTEIQQLLGKGESETAYARLLVMQSEHEGELEYDLLLAQAALLTGRSNIALFVLERVLILRPGLYQAHLLMANAYAHLGRASLAKAELRIILAAKSVQPALRKQAESMMAQLSAVEPASRLDVYIAMGFGFDSNANTSTSSQTFLGFNLLPESIATPSMSEMLNMGLGWQQRRASNSIFYTKVDWRTNLFPQASFVNNQITRYSLGWQKPWRYAVEYQGTSVDVTGMVDRSGSHNDMHLYGVIYTGKKRQSNVNLRIGQQSYLPGESIKDVRQYILSGQWALSDWRKSTYLVTTISHDVAILPNSPYGRSTAGLDLRTIVKTMNPFTVSIGTGVLYSEYRGLFFGLGRQDLQSSLNMGFHTKRWTNWELGLDLAYTDTWSSIALYDYTRFTLGLTFKRNYQR